jgi:hypothetical protein
VSDEVDSPRRGGHDPFNAAWGQYCQFSAPPSRFAR